MSDLEERMYGVLIEFWDDESGAVQRVIGPYADYDAAERARQVFVAADRVEYVRGVIAIDDPDRWPVTR